MRRAILFVVPVAVAGLVTGLVVRSSPSTAGPNRPEAARPEAAAPLPVNQVVLFSSGVGYFQRAGAVDGNTRVDLSFPVSQVNDLLKSLVLQDLDGGHIAAVSYDSDAPAERALQSFAVNLYGNPPSAPIPDQAR